MIKNFCQCPSSCLPLRSAALHAILVFIVFTLTGSKASRPNPAAVELFRAGSLRATRTANVVSTALGDLRDDDDHDDGHDDKRDSDLDCGNAKIDLVFLLDSSDSIASRWYDVLEFVEDAVDEFKVSPIHTRVGAVSYSDKVEELFPLKRYSNKDDVQDAIKRAKHLGGDTFTDMGLSYVWRNAFRAEAGGRSDATPILMVLTDGNSDREYATIDEANKLKNAYPRMHIYSIAIGKNASDREMAAICSAPTHKYYFQMREEDAIKDSVEDILEGICHGNPKSTTTSTTSTTPTTTTTSTTSTTPTTTTTTTTSTTPTTTTTSTTPTTTTTSTTSTTPTTTTTSTTSTTTTTSTTFRTPTTTTTSTTSTAPGASTTTKESDGPTTTAAHPHTTKDLDRPTATTTAAYPHTTKDLDRPTATTTAAYTHTTKDSDTSTTDRSTTATSTTSGFGTPAATVTTEDSGNGIVPSNGASSTTTTTTTGRIDGSTALTTDDSRGGSTTVTIIDFTSQSETVEDDGGIGLIVGASAGALALLGAAAVGGYAAYAKRPSGAERSLSSVAGEGVDATAHNENRDTIVEADDSYWEV